MNKIVNLSDEQIENKRLLDILRSEIQIKFQPEVSVKRHYLHLTRRINEKIKEMNISLKTGDTEDIGFQTIGRIWGYIDCDNKNKVKGRESNLSLLAEVLGYDGWKDFCEKIAQDKKHFKKSVTQFHDAETDLEIGAIITLGNEYGRNVKLEYVAFLQFKILEYNGRGDKKAGDIIEARWFEVIEPNFKEHGNKDEDIIALTSELKSHKNDCSEDIDIYTRFYL